MKSSPNHRAALDAGRSICLNIWRDAVCLTNPKAIMFFMAFFPQFLTADSQPQTLVVMMAHVSLISLVYQTGLVLVGNVVAVKLSRFQFARVLARRIVGLGLLGFGIKLAIKRQ